MTETADQMETEKKGKGGLLIALLGGLVAGGAGFYATYSGMLAGNSGGADHGVMAESPHFVPLDPLLISLGPNANARMLKFTAQLEVTPEAEEAVAAQRPRIVDLLNDYLRAVDESELEDPAALAILRAQMLHRIRTIVGDGKVQDLLIIEFVLN